MRKVMCWGCEQDFTVSEELQTAILEEQAKAAKPRTAAGGTIYYDLKVEVKCPYCGDFIDLENLSMEPEGKMSLLNWESVKRAFRNGKYHRLDSSGYVLVKFDN